MELRLKKQGKKPKDNYEVSIPKYENADKSVIGEKQDEAYNEYFTIADSISRQQADRDALNFVFFEEFLHYRPPAKYMLKNYPKIRL